MTAPWDAPDLNPVQQRAVAMGAVFEACGGKTATEWIAEARERERLAWHTGYEACAQEMPREKFRRAVYADGWGQGWQAGYAACKSDYAALSAIRKDRAA